jgi:hypothetical protein
LCRQRGYLVDGHRGIEDIRYPTIVVAYRLPQTSRNSQTKTHRYKSFGLAAHVFPHFASSSVFFESSCVVDSMSRIAVTALALSLGCGIFVPPSLNGLVVAEWELTRSQDENGVYGDHSSKRSPTQGQ